MGLIIYTKNHPNRRKQAKDVFKNAKDLKKKVKILSIMNIITISFIIYQNFEFILNLIKELYGKMA